MSDSFGPMAGAWAVMGERMADYAAVWRSAVNRNADGTYAAEDFLVDLEQIWGMTLGDAARVGAAMVDAAGPLLAGFQDDANPDPDPDPESSSETA